MSLCQTKARMVGDGFGLVGNRDGSLVAVGVNHSDSPVAEDLGQCLWYYP